MSCNNNTLKVFSGSSNRTLAEQIAEYIGLSLGKAKLGRFSDWETSISIQESVRGQDIFIIQSLSAPINENIIELLILIDALKRASSRSVNAVIPYYGYARQDRKTKARDPITAKLIADLLTAAGANRVVAMDLHAGQIQGFFNIPFDHLTSIPILANYFKEQQISPGVVISPDLGGVTRARQLADFLDMPIAVVDKRGATPDEAEVYNIIGDVKGKSAIMVDDMIDTAETIILGAQALLNDGAHEVYACCTHPVLSGSSVEKLKTSVIKEVVATNTIQLPPEKTIDKLKILSVANLMGEAIIRIHEERSVSELFETS